MSAAADEDEIAQARRNVFGRVAFTRWMGVRREYSVDGRARLVVDPRPELENMIHAMHGGVVMTLLDVAMASAAVSKLDFTRTAVTLSLNTSFLRPGLGTLTADGEVLDISEGVAQCRGEVRDASGETVARAVGAFRFLPMPDTLPPPQ